MRLDESRLMARRIFAGNKLAEDAARLAADDRASPPEAKPSLMDVVRSLSEFVETRASLGWTDPMIAALLTEAGYPITAGTLRSYRKRLRDERAFADAGAAIAMPSPAEHPEKPAMPSAAASVLSNNTEDLQPMAASKAPAPKHEPGKAEARSFAINRNNMPPDRA